MTNLILVNHWVVFARLFCLLSCADYTQTQRVKETWQISQNVVSKQKEQKICKTCLQRASSLCGMTKKQKQTSIKLAAIYDSF